MIRQIGPINKLAAQYGDIVGGSHAGNEDEEELEVLKAKVKGIEYALDALTVTERQIVELKFFERRRNVLIYEVNMPMAPNTFYKELDSAMKTMRDILK